MPSYTTLAVLALAASTASPAFAAPVQETQEQARSELEARLNLGSIFKTVGGNLALGALPGVLQHFLGGGNKSSRDEELFLRDLAELDERAGLGSVFKAFENNDSLLKTLGKGLLGGGLFGVGTTVGNKINQRSPEPEPLSLPGLSGLAKTLAGGGASFLGTQLFSSLFNHNSNQHQRDVA
ncbi:hypothetical protein B0F90DRAFT_1363622 [Multifurca ochricompacta]|uniref:DUF2780 domain-containing protein n=1 Tax=Multifurca ochricompacta TaxID=376703 RepID=A0AAD4M6K9_9AGAM|nr:hypothetical protein B0F90DRAFT_1363622 [Multifurca ochricompacta]